MSPRQQFLTTDVLRLEVEDNLDGRLVNLVQNPSGELGGWGWFTPGAGGVMSGVPRPTDPAATWLRFLVGDTPWMTTESFPVTAGWYVTANFTAPVSGSTTVAFYRLRFLWFDAAGAAMTPSTQTGYLSPSSSRNFYSGLVVPVGAVSGRVRFDVYNDDTGTAASPGKTLQLIEVTVATSASLFDLGENAENLPPAYYVDVLGSAHTISVDRIELDVGTLVATILGSALDPAKAESVIKTGRRLRLMARIPETGFDDLDYGEGLYGGEAGDWSPIFTGRIARGSTTYDYRQKVDTKRTRITLSAVDLLTQLTQETRTEGVATIAELPYVLEGCGVPWSVNGSGNQVPTAVVVARNDAAKAVDQVAITRDSAHGFAWMDRFGVLQAWDAGLIGDGPEQAGGVTVLDAGDYSNLEIDFDTERCINEVSIQYVRINPGTGETEEVAYGPYRDAESVRVNGVHAATFTVQGIDEAGLPAFAQTVLDANAWPVVRVLSARVPIVRLRATPKVLTDLYQLLTVTNERAGVDEALRVVGVHHEITTRRWAATFDFAGENRVASPQVVPSVPTSAGGRTLGQLLRPVGEVTMWWGSTGEIPPGWLRCDGTTFDTGTYPELATLLGGNTLPNLIDRFPIGAGIKALGTSGGDPTKPTPPHVHSVEVADHTHSISEQVGGSEQTAEAGTTKANLAPFAAFSGHDHGGQTGVVSGDNPTATTSEPEGEPLDVMPPWRAVHFIIRAA